MPKHIPTDEEYKQKLLSNRIINPQTNCWEWTKGTTDGYGMSCYHNKMFKVSRLIMYLEKEFELKNPLFILHSCDNRRCFNPTHLFIGTQKDNMKDMINKNRGNKAKGSKSGKSKLTEFEVLEIRKLYKEGISMYDLATKFNVAYQTINDIISGKTWKHITL